jgi:uncharacterized membrane protein YphA (DoxX/SURF4 family)
MLNPFPQLLTYTFFAPTLLRVAAALVLFYLVYSHYTHRGQIAKVRFPLVGGGAWVVWLSLIIETAAGLALFFGYGTQWAAIVGALFGLKYTIWAGKYPTYFVLSRIAALLLLVICLSLLITGAGAMGFDVPL